MADGYLFAVGGETDTESSIDRYNPDTWEFTENIGGPLVDHSFELVVGLDGLLYFIGMFILTFQEIVFLVSYVKGQTTHFQYLTITTIKGLCVT